MQRHVKLYLEHFNYKVSEECICEICFSKQQLEIHHIRHRAKNRPDLDYIENCICLCRDCHIKAHKSIYTKEFLQEIHSNYIK